VSLVARCVFMFAVIAIPLNSLSLQHIEVSRSHPPVLNAERSFITSSVVSGNHTHWLCNSFFKLAHVGGFPNELRGTFGLETVLILRANLS